MKKLKCKKLSKTEKLKIMPQSRIKPGPCTSYMSAVSTVPRRHRLKSSGQSMKPCRQFLGRASIAYENIV